MYSGDSAPLQSGLVEQAGSLDSYSRNSPAISKPNGSHTEERSSRQVPKTSGTVEEQTLEWHEVIELQAFSERKAWIEEKTKFLEKMPPVEVFVGLDAVRCSAEEVPGLPSRAELEQWLVEHDKIEKETEVFDSVELAKLKKFTKAATQRNLSPADTDLIELTLTTIYELDKLLHLLRDRTDNLELLGIRLTWEERRISAWQELHSILADLRQFLHTRGRWCPTVYDNALSEDEELPPAPEQSPPILPTRTLRRKNSVVSLASSTSDSILSSLVLSRSERFKLAERLSREAAQFSSRVASLKHNKIHAAGKALDRLIDTSRRAVPDELLDEQDRLEDQGLNGMEDVGKFVMNVVMQWKKADQIYVETIKDKNSAQTLLEEIETAKLFHPTSRQDTTFLARTTTLIKRLEMRGDPSAANSSFPRPYHPLFEDQVGSNTTILEILTNEITAAMEHAKRAEVAAKEYHTSYEAVRRVETLCKAATELSERFGSILERLERGAESTVGDGGPPDLTAEDCLQPASHSVFLTLFPALLDELARSDQEATTLLQNARPTLLDVGRPGVDPQFTSNSVATIDLLDAQQTACSRARDVAVIRVSTLKQVRDTWGSMARALEQLDDVRSDTADAIKRDMWKPQAQQDAATLTPESPSSVLPPGDIGPLDFSNRLTAIHTQIEQEIISPLDSMSSSFGPGLKAYLSSCSSGLIAALEDARRMANFSLSVRTQALEMSTVREESHRLQMRLEDLKQRFDDAVHQTLAHPGEHSISADHAELQNELKALQEIVDTFTGKLSSRIPFVTRTEPSGAVHQTSLGVRRRFSVSGFSLDVIQQATTTTYPVNPTDLDRAVRTDANTYTMLLAGTVESVKQKGDLLQLAFIARDVDKNMLPPLEVLRRAGEAVTSVQRSLDEENETPTSLGRLSGLSELVDQLYPEHGPTIVSSLSKLYGLLDQLSGRLNKHDATIATSMLNPRRRRIEDIEQEFNTWKENVEVLSERIADLQHLEQMRIAEAAQKEFERQRLEDEVRAKAEQGQERSKQEARKEEEEQLKMDKKRRAAREELEVKAQVEISEQLLFEDMEEDVFGQGPSGAAGPALSSELSDLQAHVRSLRKRLGHLDIDEIVRADKRGAAPLPSPQQSAKLEKQLSEIVQDVGNLPPSAHYPPLDAEMHILRSEVAFTSEKMSRVKQLAHLALDTRECDNVLSDLLEHVDSFPAPPSGPLASAYASDTSMPPEEQLSARLSFTRGLIDEIVSQCARLSDDSRAVSERERVLQTWEELQAMGLDRLNGQKSRPASVVSSGRSSRASAVSTATASSSGVSTKAPSFPRRERGHFLAPPLPHARRVTSTGNVNVYSRSSSRASISTKRSVSGPIDNTPTITRLQTSTFASRQRSNSVASNSSPVVPSTVKRPSSRLGLAAAAPIVSRPRAQTHTHRAASPAFSDASTSRTRSSLNMSQSSRSSWARAPRSSFPVAQKTSPPRRRQNVTVNKPYVPNPKNKLDVAVGGVVNSLPVNINIEVVEDTWRDQSGKYWIGDEDPKLCFCRILRSQTVMVRVGGGWAELSKFIKEHFADAFRLLPDSPVRVKSEEKWISSATLTQAMQIRDSNIPLSPPRTPEPRSPIPSFALSTPSPRSVDSSGSPLRAIQFIRRADRDSPVYRPDTPTRAPRPLGATLNTPRPPVWRP